MNYEKLLYRITKNTSLHITHLFVLLTGNTLKQNKHRIENNPTKTELT